VVWNLDKVLNDKAEQYDKRQSAQGAAAVLPSVASYRKVDDMTVEITTKSIDSLFPYQMLWFMSRAGAVRESRQGLGQVRFCRVRHGSVQAR